MLIIINMIQFIFLQSMKMIGGHYSVGFALLLVCGALAAPRLPMEYEAPSSLQPLNAPFSDPVILCIFLNFKLLIQHLKIINIQF